MIPINAIIGCDDGQFTVSVFYNMVTKNRDQRRKKEGKFPADKPEQVIEFLKSTAGEIGNIDNVMFSSSMDFPKEYGVTNAQVSAFDAILKSNEHKR